MYENIIIKENFPEDMPYNYEKENYDKIRQDIINILSANQFTISQIRYLFNQVITQFERYMPVSNHTKF